MVLLSFLTLEDTERDAGFLADSTVAQVRQTRANGHVCQQERGTEDLDWLLFRSVWLALLHQALFWP